MNLVEKYVNRGESGEIAFETSMSTFRGKWLKVAETGKTPDHSDLNPKFHYILKGYFNLIIRPIVTTVK